MCWSAPGTTYGRSPVHRPIVIAGSREQFEDWCRTYRTNPVAATFVDSPEALEACLREHADVRLWGTYRANPAFQALTKAWQPRPST